MELMVHYSNNVFVLQGIPNQIAQYKIKEAKPKQDKYSFILRISNNIHQIPCLESAELQEEWVEEEKIPVKKDVPAAKTQDKKSAQPEKSAEAQDADMKEEVPPMENST